jgi:hypothetical protein
MQLMTASASFAYPISEPSIETTFRNLISRLEELGKAGYLSVFTELFVLRRPAPLLFVAAVMPLKVIKWTDLMAPY